MSDPVVIRGLLIRKYVKQLKRSHMHDDSQGSVGLLSSKIYAYISLH